jgi:hypothetical protein
MNFRSVLMIFLFALVYLYISAEPALAGDEWKPVDPAQLAMTSPIVEKDADAEAIFWEVYVQDNPDGFYSTLLKHYIRIKIFTERGKETQSKIDLRYSEYGKINDIAARTIKPDGTIIELKKEAIFERVVAKVGGYKYKVKSFALPSVEPGAIIEYRWREERINLKYLSLYDRFQMQRDIPVQVVKYFFKPPQSPTYRSLSMRTRMYNANLTSFVKEKDGFFSATLTNMPAFREEPRMPPEDQVRAWMLVYYPHGESLSPEKFWPKYGRELYEEYKPLMKVSDEIKKAAATAIADATTPEQKLERMFTFCRSKIMNVYDDASGLTATDRAKLKQNESPSDTLKRGKGTPQDIDLLFGALATAAGFETRIAILSDRGDLFFDINNTDRYFLDILDIAVKVGDGWRFFSPGSMYVPFGMLRWQEEGLPALICDPKEPTFVETPLSPAEKTLQKRTAKLILSEDGTLEGDVLIEYTGQFAVEKKEENDELSPAVREENMRDRIKEKMGTAEVSNINIENVTDPVKPFIYSYHIRVPGYAQRTGKRLFVQPAFFQRGIGVLFSAADRKMPVYFHYPWKEDDSVTIKMPAGYKLDNADSPTPFAADKVAKYEVKLYVVRNEDLLYKRTFSFNGLLFPTKNYTWLKQIFEAVHEQDNHTITLKQAAASQ